MYSERKTPSAKILFLPRLNAFAFALIVASSAPLVNGNIYIFDAFWSWIMISRMTLNDKSTFDAIFDFTMKTRFSCTTLILSMKKINTAVVYCITYPDS